MSVQSNQGKLVAPRCKRYFKEESLTAKKKKKKLEKITETSFTVRIKVFKASLCGSAVISLTNPA